jgi:hypothetical protein
MSNQEKIERLKAENMERRIELYKNMQAHPSSFIWCILTEEIRWHDDYIKYAEKNWLNDDK